MAGCNSKDTQQSVAIIDESDEDVLDQQIGKEMRLLDGHKKGQQKCEMRILSLTTKMYSVKDRKKARLEAAPEGCTPKACAPPPKASAVPPEASAVASSPPIPNPEPNLPVPKGIPTTPASADIPNTTLAEEHVNTANVAQPMDTRVAPRSATHSSKSSSSPSTSPTSPPGDATPLVDATGRQPQTPDADYTRAAPTPTSPHYGSPSPNQDDEESSESPGGPYEHLDLQPAPSARAELIEGPGAAISPATKDEPADSGSEDLTFWAPPAETPVPADDQLPPKRTHPLPTNPTELQLTHHFGTLSDTVMTNLLIDPKPSLDCIVICDDPTIDENEKVFKNSRTGQYRGNSKIRLTDGIRFHHLLPTRFVDPSSLPAHNDKSLSTALCIQKIGCEFYNIYNNEGNFIPEIYTLGSLLPFGHKCIVGSKVFYGQPKNRTHYWKYAGQLFTGQITIVLATMELRDLFWRELNGRRLGNNSSPCEIKIPDQCIYADRHNTFGSTRYEKDIWEFRKQFSDSSGSLVDSAEYSKSYRESMREL